MAGWSTLPQGGGEYKVIDAEGRTVARNLTFDYANSVVSAVNFRDESVSLLKDIKNLIEDRDEGWQEKIGRLPSRISDTMIKGQNPLTGHDKARVVDLPSPCLVPTCELGKDGTAGEIIGRWRNVAVVDFGGQIAQLTVSKHVFLPVES